MDWYEYLQSGGIVGAIAIALKAALDFGQIREKVENNTQSRHDYVNRDAYKAFENEVLRRLERIENKQDRIINGK